MHHTSWLLSIPGLFQHPDYLHVNGAILVFIVITCFSLLAFLALGKNPKQYVVPKPTLSVVSVFDLIVERLHGLIVGIVGHHGEVHVPFLGSCFIFILVSNFLGILPFGAAPTANVNTTFALGIVTFIYYNVMGIKAHGAVGYAKHFLGGLGIFGVFIAAIEMISHCIRPLSLGLRLFINLFIDHTLLLSFESMFAWLLPVPFLMFGVFVAALQAFIYTVLSAVYLQMATDH